MGKTPKIWCVLLTPKISDKDSQPALKGYLHKPNGHGQEAPIIVVLKVWFPVDISMWQTWMF